MKISLLLKIKNVMKPKKSKKAIKNILRLMKYIKVNLCVGEKILIEKTLPLYISGMILALLILVLDLLNFQPIKYLIELDNLLYSYVFIEQSIDKVSPHPVIFVDIDDFTMDTEKNYIRGSKTPRSLQAEIIRKIKSTKASVIFLDFDYRESSESDDELALALCMPGCPVVIPKIIYSTPIMPCIGSERVTYRTMPFRAPTIFDDIVDFKNIFTAHVRIENTSGLYNGICTYFDVESNTITEPRRLISAPTLLNNLAINSSKNMQYDKIVENRPALDRFSVKVGASDDQIKNRYFKYSARRFFWTKDAGDLYRFDSAIVIVGASHQGSDDVHKTLRGELPGSLLIANAILQLQDGRIKIPNIFSGLFADIITLFVESIILI